MAPTEPGAPGRDAQGPATAGSADLKPMCWNGEVEGPGVAVLG